MKLPKFAALSMLTIGVETTAHIADLSMLTIGVETTAHIAGPASFPWHTPWKKMTSFPPKAQTESLQVVRAWCKASWSVWKMQVIALSGTPYLLIGGAVVACMIKS